MSTDALLKRLERNAVLACLVMAGAAVALRGGRLDVAIGVLGGGVLAAVSYWSIKTGIDGLVAALMGAPRTDSEAASGGAGLGTPDPPPPPRRLAPMAAVVRLAGRYALLALIAYVMIARLRLHPLGLLAGASSVVAAAALEAVRVVAGPGTSRHKF